MRKLKWGLIGCGDIARKRVAPALRDLPEVDFVGVTRARAELAETFAREFSARKWYDMPEDLVADPEVEAVYIATPVDTHHALTALAAGARKHVLCEKPMALDTRECRNMIRLCRKSGVSLGIAYYRHFYPIVRRAKEVLTSGEVGLPVFAQITAFEFYNPPCHDPRYWFLQKERSGGGPMFDFGSHRIEVLLNLLGPVVSVRGMTSKAALLEREVEDTASALFTFGSGAQAVLAVTHATMESRDTLDIFCTDGSIHIPRLNAGEMTVRTRTFERIENHRPHENFHAPLIEDFTRAVLDDRKPEVNGETGKEVNGILAEIYRGHARREKKGEGTVQITP